ncbi:N-acetyltransferase [Deinococcus metallilatus]|uniref:GNAT family N-acetyltransferase n=1 Tax=Deinococcus metallilatus TaxID=1211322 RepID=A0AAJ5F571_9DEIO|nr:N-acetyltransferase [Deinococcus metallilatus]RXJ10213.1 N-acetyltransferase [Deinococcus metallilatus]TLK27850.1 GNAT family N-acetyltransferase [Deinococcus metallilatus]
MLSRSYRIALATEEDGRVIGFAQAISDGVLTAFIPLLEVQATYRGQGVGSALMRRLLAQLDHLYAVDLSCDDELVPFYGRLGFGQANLMFRRSYARQNGAPLLTV